MARVEAEKRNVVLKQLAVEYLPVDAIQPNSYNPNRQSAHDFELLCKSIAADGFTQPIVVLRSTKVIVDGEHRWRACKALGFTEVPVVLTDMTPEQARIATLRHNRARGSEDAAMAAEVLKELAALGAIDYAAEELSLDPAEVSRLLKDMPDEELKALGSMGVGDAELGAKGHGLSEFDKTHGVDTDADRKRAQEKALGEAKEREERAMAERDKTYRLVLVFTGPEADVVKAVLGAESKNHGQAILALCQEVHAQVRGVPT